METYAEFGALLGHVNARAPDAIVARRFRIELLTALAGRLPHMQMELPEYLQSIDGVCRAYGGLPREPQSSGLHRAVIDAQAHLTNEVVPRAVANVHDLAGLRALLDQGLISAGVVRQLLPEVRDAVADLLVAIAPRILGMHEAEQEAAFGRVGRAFNDLPEEQRTTERTRALTEVQDSLMRAKLDRRVAEVNRFSDLRPLLGPSGASGPPAMIDRLRDPAKNYFLAGLAGRISVMEKDEWPAAHSAISEAMATLPRHIREEDEIGANFALHYAEVDELLAEPLRRAYEQCYQLEENADAAYDLAGVKAVLAKDGIGGPPVLPDDTLGVCDDDFGRPTLVAYEPAPQPLGTLALHVASKGFRLGDCDDAVRAIFDTTNTVSPKYRRVQPFFFLIHAAQRMRDDTRTGMYEDLLQSVSELWHSGEINEAEYAFLLGGFARRHRHQSQATVREVRTAIEGLSPNNRSLASIGISESL